MVPFKEHGISHYSVTWFYSISAHLGPPNRIFLLLEYEKHHVLFTFTFWETPSWKPQCTCIGNCLNSHQNQSQNKVFITKESIAICMDTIITDGAGIFRVHHQKKTEFFHAMYPKWTLFLQTLQFNIYLLFMD